MNHILVVDDETGIRSSLEEILREEGYGVAGAADAKEAVTLLRPATQLSGLNILGIDTCGRNLELQLHIHSGDVYTRQWLCRQHDLQHSADCRTHRLRGQSTGESANYFLHDPDRRGQYDRHSGFFYADRQLHDRREPNHPGWSIRRP